MLAFIGANVLSAPLLRRPAFVGWRFSAADMLSAGLVGVLLGGRLGYAIFYNPSFYFANPLHIFRLWDGGMSFHGGLLGVIIALIIFSRRANLPFWRVADFAAVLTPLGLGLGRIGNFINGELPGRVTEVSWGLVFPGESFMRHPSSLYQAFLEGAILMLVMWLLTARRYAAGTISAAFLIGYALCRLFSELFRQPDAHLGFIFGGVSMGQLLSLPMLLAGVILLMNWQAMIVRFWRAKSATAAKAKTTERTKGKKRR